MRTVIRDLRKLFGKPEDLLETLLLNILMLEQKLTMVDKLPPM